MARAEELEQQRVKAPRRRLSVGRSHHAGRCRSGFHPAGMRLLRQYPLSWKDLRPRRDWCNGWVDELTPDPPALVAGPPRGFGHDGQLLSDEQQQAPVATERQHADRCSQPRGVVWDLKVTWKCCPT